MFADLHIARPCRSVRPFKTDPPLDIDADAELSLSIAVKRFKAIAGQIPKIID
ncbi:MAG: hypothetical protein ACI9JL_003693 [Paracoccaceae bacterium]